MAKYNGKVNCIEESSTEPC